MAEAVDFSKVNTRQYKVWRIVSASPQWAEIYRNREKRLRNYRGGIIFPEQLIGLNQNMVFQVSVQRNGNDVVSSIKGITNYIPQGKQGERLDTLEAIREYEAQNIKPGSMKLGNSQYQAKSFYDLDIFTNAKDAIKYQQKLLDAAMSQIG